LEKEIKLRLIKHITFLESELQDFPNFRPLLWEDYQKDRSKRRDVERWVENIINSSIDLSKIILVSEKISVPDTYRELVASISLVPGFDKERMDALSGWVRFRNIIAHEYLDIRWASIRKFIDEAEPLYRKFLMNVKEYLDRQLEANPEKK
jgi:uncharacterized protein YutE (UPF0331/DUF86 family)